MQMDNDYNDSDYKSCKLTAATIIITSDKVFIFNHYLRKIADPLIILSGEDWHYLVDVERCQRVWKEI